MADTREPTPRPLGHRATCPWLLSHGRVECTCGEYPEYAAPVPAPPAEPTHAGMRVVSNPSIPPDTAVFVDPVTGKLLGGITGLAAPAADPVAQQPPPTQDDDLVARLNGLADNWPVPVRDRLLVLEAAARIESDARTLEWTRGHWRSAIEALAASRERERALREALRKVRAHTSYTPTADPVPLLAGLLASIERIADAALATPDSAASPTGGREMKWRVLKRVNGLTEFVCEHGVGHPSKALTPPRFYYGTHGCDGCCARPDFPEAKHADSAAEQGEAK